MKNQIIAGMFHSNENWFPIFSSWSNMFHYRFLSSNRTLGFFFPFLSLPFLFLCAISFIRLLACSLAFHGNCNSCTRWWFLTLIVKTKSILSVYCDRTNQIQQHVLTIAAIFFIIVLRLAVYMITTYLDTFVFLFSAPLGPLPTFISLHRIAIIVRDSEHHLVTNRTNLLPLSPFLSTLSQLEMWR